MALRHPLQQRRPDSERHVPADVVKVFPTESAQIVDATVGCASRAANAPDLGWLAGAVVVASFAFMILHFKDALFAEGQKAANIKVKMSRLRTLTKWAFDNDLAPINAASGIDVKIPQAERVRRLVLRGR